jgi:hypothetical protein
VKLEEYAFKGDQATMMSAAAAVCNILLLNAGNDCARCLPGGDLVTSGSQASRRTGHVYVWSADPARASFDDMLLSRFADDMKPPPKPKPAGDDAGACGAAAAHRGPSLVREALLSCAGGGGGGSGGGGGLPDGIKISACQYEARDQLAGTKDGQYGFFRREDGAVMACAWSSAAGEHGEGGEGGSARS